jgi:hypothetical protein
VTAVVLLGGIGVLPVDHRPPASAETGQAAAGASMPLSAPRQDATPAATPTAQSTGTPAAARGGSDRTTAPAGTRGTRSTLPPPDSGAGRRVVFDISDQRVWIVDRREHVEATYLVSGSVTDNLQPGQYAVYSRSRWAVGVEDSGVMQYFVRFAHGQHAAIGFHSIPTKNGHPLQTEAQLGTPRSHGCIRQALPDAIRMWNFASIGTTVVVTA